MSREVSEVCRYLKTKSINIPTNNEWIISCVECFKEQGNYSLIDIQELVYQQWLLADLSDIGVQVLPRECFTEEKFILEGRYAVQLNYFVNVAVSFHKQLQKIRRPDVLKNLDIDSEAPSAPDTREHTGNRTLKIELTDGVVTITGFEDQFISSLQEPFVPGKKAILVGPIECRKTVLFLKPKNIILLGGEVDALLIPNATENILARKLKLPENPDPYSQHLFTEVTHERDPRTLIQDDCSDDDEEAMMMLAEVIEKKNPDIKTVSNNSVDTIRNARDINSRASNNITTNSLNNKISFPHKPETYKDSAAKAEPNREQVNQQNPKPQVFSVSSNITDLEFDDDFDMLAVQTVASAEKSLAQKQQSIDEIASQFRAYDMFDSEPVKKDLKIITELKQKLNESYNKTSAHNSSINDGAKLDYGHDGKIIVDYLSDKASPLISLANEPEITAGTPSSMEFESSDSSSSFLSLEPFPPRKRPCIITVFAKVVKVLKKPKLKGDMWSVSALVEAKGMKIEVSFASDVIDKVFSVTAAEIVSKREEFTSDPLLKQKMNETLKESQLRFSKLACDMTFNFKDAISTPVVIDVMINR